MVTYYTKDGSIDSIWVDQKAQDAAKSFFQDKDPINSSQLRKFYGDVKSLERQWLTSGKNDAAFAVIAPMIKLLKAKSEYALKRKVIPQTFRDWLWSHVDSIRASRDFEAFLLHFEAVVGFSYGQARKLNIKNFN